LSLARRFLLPGLIAGALVRAAALPLPGTVDVGALKLWSFAAAYDVTGVYGVGGSPPERRLLYWQGNGGMTVDYPPLALYELAATGRAYAWWHPLFEDSPTLTVVTKLPGLVAQLALVAALLTGARRMFGDDVAAWTALAVWLNPAVVLDGPVLGYMDAAMAMPAVLALMAAAAGRPWLTGVLAAITLLTKAQAIFVLPVIAAALIWRPSGSRGRTVGSAALAFGVTSGLVLLPFIVRGAWANLLQALGRLGTHDMLSAQAANVWWIFTWVLRVRDVLGEWGWWRALTQELRILAISRAVDLGYPNARLVGVAIVGPAIGWAVWRVRRDPSLASSALFAGWCAYAYALFAAQVHENHMHLAVPFLAVGAGLEASYRRIFWTVSAIVALNMYLFYGLGQGWPPVIARSWTLVDMTVVLSLVNVAVFAWLTVRLARRHTPSL
jgi:hypothetical protein